MKILKEKYSIVTVKLSTDELAIIKHSVQHYILDYEGGMLNWYLKGCNDIVISIINFQEEEFRQF